MCYAGRRPIGRLFYLGLVGIVLAIAGVARPILVAAQSGPAMTTVSDTVFRADGTPAQGTVIITWPAFVTADGVAVAAGTTNVTLGANGALSVALAPNVGANPGGVYYSAVFQLGPGEVKTEYWLVPTTSPANLATVRTTPGSGLATQPVSMQYVNTALAGKANDNAVVHLNGSETISGSKNFAVAPSVPAPTSTGQVANKAYVDTSVATVGAGSFLSTAGGTMTGPITLPANPVAPLQASTKQYVDGGFAVKANLISGLVPPSELGSGTANASTCLLGNGSWGSCAAGTGTGNVSTTPTSNQNIIQPAGTQFGADNVNGIRYVTASPSAFNWSATVTGTNLTGPITANLNPCPKGIFGADNTTFISINSGAEYALLQGGGTCVPGSAGSVTFTVTGTYTNPTIGSASSGIQEALIDAQANGTGVKKANYRVVFQPTNPPNTSYYAINAAVTIPNGVADIDFSGASIDCEAIDACFKIVYPVWNVVIHGARVSTKTTMAGGAITNTACSGNVSTITTSTTPLAPTPNQPVTVDIQNTDNTHYWGLHQVLAVNPGVSFTMADNNCSWAQNPGAGTYASAATPGGWALEHAFIEDNGTDTVLRDMYLDSPAWSAGKLNNFIVVLNDQAFTVDNLVTGGMGVQCDANYCGQVIYNPGPFSGYVQSPAIGRVTNSNISLQCQGNGINWLGGNGIKVSDNTVIQGFQQFSIQTGTMRGGYAMSYVDSLYNEVGNCSNPHWTAAGFSGVGARNMAGISVLGGSLKITGGAVGQEPQFATGGATTYEYWMVICDGANCSLPMRFGQAAPLNSNPYTIGWPRYASQTSGVVTYYILRTTGIGYSLIAPYGAGNWLVASAVPQCASLVCTGTDSNATSPQSYTVSGNPQLTPFVRNWPGSIVLSGGATMYGDDLSQTSISSIVSTTQNTPSVFLQRCSGGSPGLYVSCPAGNSAVNNNGAVGGFLLQNAPSGGGQTANLKGRINITTGPWSSLNSGHIITLVDSNPFKTWADANHRPTNDANDTYLGLDNGSVGTAAAQLAIGAPAAISSYIGNAGDNTSWKERLTASAKTFNVPVTVNGNLTVAGGTVTLPVTGTGAQCLHVSSTGVVSGTGADCGSGGGGSGTVNSGSATQLAMYTGTGTAVSGDSALTDSGGTLTYAGAGGLSAAAGTFSGNLTVNGQLLVAGPWMVSSPIPGTAMAAAGAGTSALGISNDGNFYISANAGAPQKVATAATSSYFSNLWQEDANNVGEYNGLSAQGLNVYGTRADASNYERLSLTYDTVNPNFFKIDAQAGGSGTKRGLAFWVNGAARWGIDQLDMFKPFIDNTYDLGSSTFQVRNGYFGTGVVTPSITLAGDALSNVIGTPTANLMTAGTVSGTGQPLCTDGTGNLTITTVGCPPGTGTIGGSGAIQQFAYWTNTNGLGAAPLSVAGANAVEQYNGTNVQTFNVYGTRTDGSNYERVGLTYVPGDTYFELQTQQGGTGSQHGFCFGVNNSCKWAVDTNTAFKPFNDNVRDIGTGTARVRDFYLGRNLVMSGTATTYNGKATAGTGLAPVYGTVSSTGLTAAVASSTLCLSATCGAGQYEVNYYLDSTVACTTAGSAAGSLTIGWTDETSAKTLQVPLSGAGVSGGNSLGLGNTANFGSGSIAVWSAGSVNLTYSTSYTGCTAGRGTYALRVVVRQLQ